MLLLFAVGLVACSDDSKNGNNENDQAQDNNQGQENNANNQAENDNANADDSEDDYFILATTTSTQDSGLLDVLVPMFEEETGYMVKTIAVGTGKALEMGKNGEADALLVHAPASEQELVDAGQAINYQLVMHNDFVIVGPKADPLGIKDIDSLKDVFTTFASSEDGIFVSRGDDSGTHKKELSLWDVAGVEKPTGETYQETGSGMGDTLKVADQKAAYTMTDRATYLALQSAMDLEIVFEGADELFNIYHVMQVNPELSDKIKAEPAEAFVNFMIREDVQEVIGEFGKEEYGQPLFFPDAK